MYLFFRPEEGDAVAQDEVITVRQETLHKWGTIDLKIPVQSDESFGSCRTSDPLPGYVHVFISCLKYLNLSLIISICVTVIRSSFDVLFTFDFVELL